MVEILNRKYANAFAAHIQAEKTVRKREHMQALAKHFFASVGDDFLHEYADPLFDLLDGLYAVVAKKGTAPCIATTDFTYNSAGIETAASAIFVSVDDSPFLVDSIRIELSRSGLDLKGMVNMAGVSVLRQDTGALKAIGCDDTAHKEACFIFIVPTLANAEAAQALVDRLHTILEDVNKAVSDWGGMKNKMEEAIQNIAALPTSCFTAEERDEACAFLTWLKDYFTFLGARSYRHKGQGKEACLTLVEGSGLGVLRDEAKARKKRYYSDMALDTRAYAQSKRLLIVAKTNTRSTIHRPPYTDYIIIKLYDQQGVFIGETRFIGLFTSDAYESDPTRIPFLKRKVANIVKRAQLVDNGYAYKRLMYLLKTFPRDELFQATEDQLYSMMMGVLFLQDRSVTKVLFRRDIFHRYISCLVYLPRDHFTTELADQIEACLKQDLQSNECTATPMFSESSLARIYIVVRVDSSTVTDAQLAKVESRIVALSSGWKGALSDRLNAFSVDGQSLFKRYASVFPAGYQEMVSPEEAVQDLMAMRALSDTDVIRTRLFYQGPKSKRSLVFKVYSLGQKLPPARSLTLLADMGLLVESEHSAKFTLPDHSQPVWLMEFLATPLTEQSVFNDTLAQRFGQLFLNSWQGLEESDALNALVLSAGLNGQEVRMLRAYQAYFKQIAFPISTEVVHQTLLSYPKIARALVAYFHRTFQPGQAHYDDKDLAKYHKKVNALLGHVSRLDEERVLRQFLEAIGATVRTNYYQLEDGANRFYLSFKLRSGQIPHVPSPAPMFEIFVYAARFEAVHLRSDRIARGGLRWSDRGDFRTEILGLVKAQIVKNALIVPAGAKGGFVVKPYLHADADPFKEGLICYRAFISAMLQITDNLVGSNIVKPVDVVCHDEDDPYLVVAADKGTSSNSDIANEVALNVLDQPFWLGDAFASGGSNGYDHKAMGITARGAWEAVKWHFRTLERDMDNEPFTVVGIGGMAGDVFGNGMLLSKGIQLIAAFNHNAIFIDPNPDPKVAYKERQRLFKRPGLGWADYNTKCLSKGGAVYARSQKNITLSAQAAQALGLGDAACTMGPDQVIQAILKAPVDLLWNGGIGTYIKAQNEHHVAVGDPANDALRVNGRDLRCKMIAEGGNLGATQLGRIEYALHTGGCVNTDFIDNSAGVDCSDREVNIKILLNQLIEQGHLEGRARDALLAKMEPEVAQLVLANNVAQNLALSLEQDTVGDYIYLYESFMDQAEHDGLLDKTLEFLPSHQQLRDRKMHKVTLTRPELSVLLAYAKNILKEQILAMDLTKHPLADHFVHGAFPPSLVKKYGPIIGQHRLYDAILATELSNAFIADVGLTFLPEMRLSSAHSVQALVKAYLFLYQVFDLHGVHAQLRDVAATLPMPLVRSMYQSWRVILRTSMRWVVCHSHLDCSDPSVSAYYAEHLRGLFPKVTTLLQGSGLQRWQTVKQSLEQAGVPMRLAKKIASLGAYYPCLNIVSCSHTLQKPDLDVARVYFTLSHFLSVLPVRSHLSYHDYSNRWEIVARFHLKTELDRLLRQMLLEVYGRVEHARDIPSVLTQHEEIYRAWQDVIARAHGASKVDFSVLFVIVRLLDEWVCALKEAQ